MDKEQANDVTPTHASWQRPRRDLSLWALDVLTHWPSFESTPLSGLVPAFVSLPVSRLLAKRCSRRRMQGQQKLYPCRTEPAHCISAIAESINIGFGCRPDRMDKRRGEAAVTRPFTKRLKFH
jgi:hypothetical protein